MSVAWREAMTAEEFLAWEERQEHRHEFDGVQTYAMTRGSTRDHASIQAYVILQQDFIGATVFRRAGDLWTADTYGAGTSIGLSALGIDLPIDELYEGLDLSP